MNIHRFIIACTLIFAGVLAAFANAFSSQNSITNNDLKQQDRKGEPKQIKNALDEPSFPPFEFLREGAANPEIAAETLCRACATASPEHFVRHLLLGVCDGSIDTLQKFAECLHSTKFHHGEDSFTIYDFPPRKGISRKKPFRAIASRDFDLQLGLICLFFVSGK